MDHDMIELAFALEGRVVPRDYRLRLCEALQRVLPWLADTAGAGVHRLKLVVGGDGELLVSPRTRLVLRLPRARAEAALALTGAELQLGEYRLCAAQSRARELLAYGTLYAPLVVTGDADETSVDARLRKELAALDVAAPPICGRWQSLEGGLLAGCSVMLAGLAREQSLRVLQAGLGPHRLLGCGLFVPHRSAAAVGAPA
ncbi:type I-MYXAN CRISPR-associated protein Cas6/Cmx6 [Ramlibacter sp. AN1133]|uniref:type I-MYXAN CRISPR-associated protein Cas6/Cmx6 n=1 Tax=Ramlibacter sp. AN1133 TaxID=3133429 RepID=UPI0030C05CC5